MAQMRVKANLEGGVAVVKALMSHPMETGQRKDKAGKPIPAHFIQEVTAEHNGKNVLTALWGAAISQNPYLSFKFKGAKAGDTLKISWVDNKGESESVDVSVE